MDVILLPHHNTVTSLQKLQHAQVTAAQKTPGCLFLPSYPLVSVLAHVDERDAEDKRCIETKMKALRDMLKNVSGSVSFGEPVLHHTSQAFSEISGTLTLPVLVPFMDALKEAGFQPADGPYILLGNCTPSFSTVKAEEFPSPSRSFRIALMQQFPLSENCPAAAFSWKFSSPFWVKLR